MLYTNNSLLIHYNIKINFIISVNPQHPHPTHTYKMSNLF